MESKTSPQLPLFIGCPVWNCPHWADSVFPAKTPKSQRLNWYSQMFNTVEGNSSFYSLPTNEQARRWGDETVSGFRLCLKFPRLISHELALENAEQPTRDLLRVLEVLASADRLGPTFLQLGPKFEPIRHFERLLKYLDQLPSEFPWAVEVRHAGWFDADRDGGVHELRLIDALRDRQIDWVVFDSRALNQAPPDDEIERVSQSRKPQTPLRRTVTGKHPMLRLIGRNRLELVQAYIDEWAPVVADWVSVGLEPYVFTHAPDDVFAPEFARRFWQAVKVQLPQPQCELPRLPPKPRQLELLL